MEILVFHHIILHIYHLHTSNIYSFELCFKISNPIKKIKKIIGFVGGKTTVVCYSW